MHKGKTFLLQVLNAYICAYVRDSGVLVYLSIDLWWAAWTGVGGRQSGRAQKGSHRKEKEDISMELVTAGRGWASIQLAWRLYQGMCVTGGLGGALHCAAPCASKAKRPRDVICLMESVVVFLLHHGMCFHLQQRRLCFVYVVTLDLCYSNIRCIFVYL